MWFSTIKVSMASRAARARLASGTAVALLAAFPSHAQVQGCALENGVLKQTCSHANQGQVVKREVGANTAQAPVSDLGDLGFSISIDPVDPRAARRAGGSPPAVRGDMQETDRLFADLGIQLSYDGLGAKQRLNIGTADLRRSYVAGDTVVFRASTNYPAWIERAEVRIKDRDGKLTIVDIGPNGQSSWIMPSAGATEMHYTLRVYDTQGRYDETVPLPLTRTSTRLEEAALNGPVIAVGEGEDRTARRTIPVRGGAVTVTGRDVPFGTAISVMGETVPLDVRRGFFVQRILPTGDHGVKIGVGSLSQTRDVSIPERDVFATGIIDLTLGRDFATEEEWSRGRLAGFAQGVLANGTRFTVSADTTEDDLRDLFRNFGRKDPNNVLRGIKAEDVWVTTGDDSTTEDLAPTSGKLFFKLERNGSHLMWGDFKATEDLSRIVRSDRTLYGLNGTLRATEVMSNGDSRYRISGYASQPDSLMQRDVFRGTGGSSYFLSRRDIESGTETLVIELRDPVSGRVISARRLVEGQDYRINPVQGVVILSKPLAPSAAAGGVLSDRPLGDYDVNLVAQYEYVPTTGDVDGITAGARAETWVTDQIRLGVSMAQEGSGLADNELVGGDLLWQRSDETWLNLEVAQSEGPGFGSALSLNGGLDIDPATPSAGVVGKAALGYRIDGRVDLAELGAEGFVSGYFDDREAGFTSPDLDIEHAQQAYGVTGEVAVSARARLTFGADRFSDALGKARNDARVGASVDLSETRVLDVEIAQTDRENPGSTISEDNGRRTDLGARLTWQRSLDQSIWVFGQSTLERSGGLGNNDRLGFGAEAHLSDAFRLLGEVSHGTTGAAGRAELAWAPNASTTYTLGYRLDPTRLLESETVTGSDRGTVVLGAQSQVNDRLRYTTEHSYSALGSEPALQTTYGISYTPSDVWRYDMGLLAADNRESDGTNIKRRGVSLGFAYSGGEGHSAGLRAEFRTEDSDTPARARDRDTLLVSGNFERMTNPNWRLIGALDAILSDADGDNLRDGRFVEGKLGYAYRPIDNDRLNALFSYTFLYDMPGADQVNVDGNLNGPKQRSHIVNLALNYDLNQQFTLGGKYGFRLREEAARGSDSFSASKAHLGVIRLDYHVVHNWDIMSELRAMSFPDVNTTDLGALLAVYRDLGDKARIGVGYSWGGVKDDLRSFETNREGVFLNVIGKF